MRLGILRHGNYHIKAPGKVNWHDTKHNNLIIKLGQDGDVPVPFDYFGEGQARLAVFRPSDGTWLIKGKGLANWDSSKGNIKLQFGEKGDIPVP